MVIDQRNAGVAVTINSSAYTYAVDRFFGFGEPTDGVYTLQQSTTAPTGFNNSLKVTITTADASIGSTQRYFIGQKIEGYNIADMGFGTASSKTFTISAQVQSSVTGTFGGVLMNDAFDRAYPFTYTITTANTWTPISITIAGDTTGTWLTTNGSGLNVFFSIGAGSSRLGTAGAWQTPAAPLFGATGQTNLIATNGATFYITGVQLEVGTTATNFEYRQYTNEFALCQRYYWKIYGSQDTGGSSVYSGIGTGYSTSTSVVSVIVPMQTQMRINPTISYGGNIYVQDGGGASVTSISANYGGRQSSFMAFNTSGANTLGRGLTVYTGSATTDFISGLAEL
jgi:hypothetical protein